MEIEYNLTEKDIIALKVATDYDTKNASEYSKILLDKIEILLTLMNSLFADKIKVKDWETWSEPLIYKLCFHATSMMTLFKGTEIPFKTGDLTLKVLDEPSVITLLRVVMENYLTFSYLYSSKISEEEKVFRINVWKYCGIKQRTEFDISTEEAKKKQEKDVVLLEKIKNEVIESQYYLSLTEADKKIVLKGRKPRLFNSWVDLINQSDLRVSLFKKLYGYKSNYSHSEFISVFQFKSNNYQYKPNQELHFSLYLSHFIICKAIIDLTEIFPSIKTRYYLLEKDIRYEVEMLRRMACDRTSVRRN